jgi:2-dehydropantoate 2-reductase
MKIGIVGTGAMGAVYAGLLGRAGHEVWAIDRWVEHVEAIAEHGLRVTGASGDHLVDTLHVGARPADAGPCDVWVIATKAADVEHVMPAVAELLRPDDVVMPFQNGLGAGERVARHLDEDRHVVVGIAEGFGSSIRSPGAVHHNGMRLIRIGEMSGGLTDRVRRIEEVWRGAGFNVQAFEDIQQMVWEKFICNVAVSAPTAAFDVTIGELHADPELWNVAMGCMLEAHGIGVELGVRFSFEDPVAHLAEFAATIPDASPSMRLDHWAKRRSEVDVINGQVVVLGRELGRATPYNESLVAVLHAREAGFPPERLS